MLVARNGKAVRFHQSKVRVMSRLARGVRGIRMPEGHHVVSLIIPQENAVLLHQGEPSMVSLRRFPLRRVSFEARERLYTEIQKAYNRPFLLKLPSESVRFCRL